MKIDRNYERDAYIDKAVQYIEPRQRDDFKSLLKDFNKSINCFYPIPKALKYQGDFKLFNEIKLRARNAFPDDDELKITKDESKMLQTMIGRTSKVKRFTVYWQNLFPSLIKTNSKKNHESPATKS
jgi:type I restriction enzyme R subunit